MLYKRLFEGLKRAMRGKQAVIAVYKSNATVAWINNGDEIYILKRRTSKCQR